VHESPTNAGLFCKRAQITERIWKKIATPYINARMFAKEHFKNKVLLQKNAKETEKHCHRIRARLFLKEKFERNVKNIIVHTRK